ncbi:unnamed protein product [Diplocarpon coronariae]
MFRLTSAGLRSRISAFGGRRIRSFDNQDKMSIKFQTPLTLIVGVNGSGKTTIIECLKYATTGELPPNGGKGAFVHDPKLADEKEVLAQVKLGFLNGSQGEFVVSRSMSVIVKKTAMTFKTLEGNLLMKSKKSGERISMSSTVLELKNVVPQQLGVSAAILSNVIFCHQDESLWPMTEPSKLKVKFDEIFEAQKYTKAIDNIVKVRKAQSENLGKLRIHEANFKDLKEKAQKVKQKMIRLQGEIDDLDEKAKTMKLEIRAAEKVSAEKHTLKNAALGIKDTLATKRAQAKNLEYTLDSLRDNLVELEESDEWLRSTLDQYQQRMSEYHAAQLELKEEHNNLGADAKVARESISAKEIELGQHEAGKKTYDGQLVQRANLVQQAAHDHSLRGYDGDLQEDQITEFVARIKKLSRDEDRKLESVRNATRDELKKTQSTLTKLESRQATLKQEKVNAAQAITASEKKIRYKQSEMNAIDVDEGAKAALNSKVGEIQESLQVAISRYEAVSWDQKIKVEKNRLQELNETSEKLRAESKQLNKLAQDRAALDYAKGQAKEARQKLNTMVSAYKDQLTDTLGGWTPQNLHSEYQAVLDSRNHTLADAKAQQDAAAQRLKEIEFELKTARSSHSKKTYELQKNKDKLFSSIYDEDGNQMQITTLDKYLEEYQEAEALLAECRDNIANASGLLKMYNTFSTTVDEKSCCQLCEREFADQKQRSHASAKLQKLIKSLKEDVLKQDLKDSEKAFKSADAVRPLYDICKKLQDIEIPALEKDIKRLEGEKNSRVSNCERQDRLVSDEESAKRDIEGLIKTVTDITKYNSDISKHEEEITKLSSQDMLSGSHLTIDDIDEQLTACNAEIRALNHKIDKLIGDKEFSRTEISDLEKRLGVFTADLQNAKNSLEKRQAIASVIEELRDYIKQQKDVITQADSELVSLEPLFAKAATLHEDVEARGSDKAKVVQFVKDKLASTVNAFNLINANISDYIDKDGPGQLAACARDIKVLKNEQETIEKNTARVGVELNKLNSLIADSDKTKKDIQDNIRYRKTRRDLETVEEEIAELETHNADDDYEHYLREATAADRRREKLVAEKGPLVGTRNAKNAELEGMVEDWETDYKDAAELYRKGHIEVETTKAAIEDMTKCQKALDSAIMKFHSVKMEEINNLAGELWRKTYQGTDIDTIMIRSENETAASSSTSTRRNYNYRVVMVKQDAEMDMRGRCSAGQKVLACIIIRLALAECFGVNCGVIALDEPTTNLDEDNIKALARSLHAIIEERRNQPNFQIIIITHDEEFLKEMKCNDFTDNYYRVSRNAAQKSVIKMQSLADMMD